MTDTPGWTPPTEPGGSGDAPGFPPPGPPPPPPGYGGQQYGQQQQGYGGQQYGDGGYGQWGRATAPEPGIIPLRPLSLGEILDGGFAIVRQYPRVTLGLSAIVVTITQLLVFLVQYWSVLQDGYLDPDAYGGFTFQRFAGWAIGGIGSVVLAGLLTAVMGEAVLGRKTTIGATWRKLGSRIWVLVAAGVVGGLVPYFGLVLCIVPGAFLWGAWAFVTPVVVLERASVGTAIRRSWRLAVPDFWRVWGIRALSVLIAGVIQFVVVVPFTLLALGSLLTPAARIPALPLVLISFAGVVAGTVTAPFGSGVLALLYIDRRMRAEGLDVTLAQAAATP